MKLITWITCLLWVGIANLAQAGGDATAGKALFAPCIACHGQNAEGNAVLNAPLLAGQEDWYLRRQLNYFKTAIRGADERDTFGLQMRPMAMILATDQAVEDVIAYINTLPPAYAPSTLDGDPQKGQTLYRLCATCHGQNAEGNAAYQAPRLAPQHDWYLLTQMKHFKASIRGKAPNDALGMQMQAVAMTLADEQAMKHVIAYIKTLALSVK
jgi:cytochrome c oxidase subunit 2